MRYKIAIAAIALICAGVVAAQKKAPTHYEIRRMEFALSRMSARIVMLGDSIIEGVNWPELTGCLYIANRGIGSDTTTGVLNRLDDVIKLKPSAVFLMVGVNDISLKIPRETSLNNLAIIFEKLSNANVIFHPTLPVSKSYELDNSAIYELSRAEIEVAKKFENVSIVDLVPVVSGADGFLRPDLTFDGIHPAPKATEIWRDKIQNLIDKNC